MRVKVADGATGLSGLAADGRWRQQCSYEREWGRGRDGARVQGASPEEAVAMEALVHQAPGRRLREKGSTRGPCGHGGGSI